MKKLLFFFASLFLIVMLFQGCSKTSNYEATDRTLGMIRVRTWSGHIDGYYKGDTLISGTSTVWALHFGRTLTDTSFSVQELNGFLVSVLGTQLNYVSTDSVTTKTIVFDSIAASTQTAILTYYYLRDSMVYTLNSVTGYNAAAGQYYQTNEFLHTD